MNKEDFIKWIKENIPKEAEIFTGEKSEFGVYDVKIFDKHHNNQFYDWYFGM